MQELSDDNAKLVLKDFPLALKRILGDDLVGVYLYGSLATGDFVSGKSDVDLLMVLQNDIDDKQLELLTSMHKEFNASHPSWPKRIDVAYVSKSALWDFRTKPYKSIVSDGTGLLETVDAPQYYLIDWYKVQEHGVVIAGPKISEIMPPISADEFKKTIRDYMQDFSQSVKKYKKRGEQAYAVLTLCRSLYSYRFGKSTSKQAGAHWAMLHYPQWQDLIQKGLAWNRNDEMNDIVDEDNLSKTNNFMEFMLSEAEK